MVQAFGVPAFPVDTHIHRCAARWRLSSGKDVRTTERDLKALFPRSSGASGTCRSSGSAARTARRCATIPRRARSAAGRHRRARRRGKLAGDARGSTLSHGDGGGVRARARHARRGPRSARGRAVARTARAGAAGGQARACDRRARCCAGSRSAWSITSACAPRRSTPRSSGDRRRLHAAGDPRRRARCAALADRVARRHDRVRGRSPLDPEGKREAVQGWCRPPRGCASSRSTSRRSASPIAWPTRATTRTHTDRVDLGGRHALPASARDRDHARRHRHALGARQRIDDDLRDPAARAAADPRGRDDHPRRLPRHRRGAARRDEPGRGRRRGAAHRLRGARRRRRSRLGRDTRRATPRSRARSAASDCWSRASSASLGCHNDSPRPGMIPALVADRSRCDRSGARGSDRPTPPLDDRRTRVRRGAARHRFRAAARQPFNALHRVVTHNRCSVGRRR